MELTNVDLSSLLMDEGDGSYRGSTNFSSISIKHTNRELSILDLIVVQSLSCKIVDTEYNDSMIRNGGEIDGYIVSEFGKTTLLPWLRNNVVYFTSCTCSNLLTQTLTKLRCNKAQLDIMELVDMSSPLVEEGGNFLKSTLWSSILIKHTNGEYTMIDVVVVQSMSHKVSKNNSGR